MADIRFRALLASIGLKLAGREATALGFIYLQKENLGDVDCGTDAMDKITKRGKISNCVEHLTLLKESLGSIGRSDLMPDVDGYLDRNPSLFLYPCAPAVSPTHTTLHLAMEENESDTSKSTVIATHKRTDLGDRITSGNAKRRRVETEEERQLEEATGDMTCDSTSDSTDDEDDTEGKETTEEDREFMAEAQKRALKSEDEQTKVGAILVDPVTKRIIAEGWNRWPHGCEDRFTWTSVKGKPLQDGKHLYVVYAIRAAIFDAYNKGASPANSILYTTLYPSNVCAQCIREAQVAEVVYISDKFHKTKFMKASRKLMKGIKCRLFSDKDSDLPKQATVSLQVVAATVSSPMVSSSQ